MKHKWYRENLVACSSNLLRLITALIKENRPYHEDPDKMKELKRVERKYNRQRSGKQTV
jgi:hypothetical protein